MSGKGWTDTEKVGFFFQIIGKMGGSIPWGELELPEGRTQKACQVMIDKEKAKIRKAKEAEAEANGEDVPATPKTPASGKKRGAKAVDEEDGAAKKKPKTPRKKKESAREDSSSEGGDGAGLVKYESADDGLV
ncbi:hypothetical protein M409DRAFT_16039 [Zasmidium cellare ATCC 36951]|uniref:Uncharacterized protein n=1 Tax=Zasmidium cellare ATCC 36951 TaxID=1080233 RepID=A0A6A6D806_ZASCE|nr:uncharacterized protein M409DRAFT_16039 [Zasmidium cellare ATCC 36951]KAF2173766.1 hypothetical protein M409DRAFT_16039 [Zasmidium cellare ATCC 36951]